MSEKIVTYSFQLSKNTYVDIKFSGKPSRNELQILQQYISIYQQVLFNHGLEEINPVEVIPCTKE